MNNLQILKKKWLQKPLINIFKKFQETKLPH